MNFQAKLISAKRMSVNDIINFLMANTVSLFPPFIADQVTIIKNNNYLYDLTNN